MRAPIVTIAATAIGGGVGLAIGTTAAQTIGVLLTLAAIVALLITPKDKI